MCGEKQLWQPPTELRNSSWLSQSFRRNQCLFREVTVKKELSGGWFQYPSQAIGKLAFGPP